MERNERKVMSLLRGGLVLTGMILLGSFSVTLCGPTDCCPLDGFVPGEVVVWFPSGTDPVVEQQIIANIGATILESSSPVYRVGVPVGQESEFVALFLAEPLVSGAELNSIFCGTPLPDCRCCPPQFGCTSQLVCGLQSVTITLGKSLVSPGDVVIDWSPDCETMAEDYGIYEGSLGAWDSHVANTCADTSERFTETVMPSNGSAYFVVVPRYATEEGSYGVDGYGTERAISTSPCAGTQIIETCML